MNDKNQLRKTYKTIRADFKGAERERADSAICKRFLEEFKEYESFFIYNSYSSEADTKSIISALLNAGKRVCLPCVEGEKIVAVPYGQTRVGAFGIEEPCGQAYDGEIQITVIPLLAVNDKMYRIGYGKGFYDRFLKDRKTIKVGLGYYFQIADFKEDEWDVPLDLFLCERGIYGK